MKVIRRGIFIVCFLFLFSSDLSLPAQAQSSLRLNIEAVTFDAFPQIEAFISILDAQGFPIEGVTADALTLFEDDQPVPQFVVSPIENTQQALAFVLAIDTSGSMVSGGAPTPLSNAIQAAKEFVGALAPQDQVAILAFSDSAVVVQQMTADKDLLVSQLDTLQTGANTALFDALVEGVALLKNRSERRVLILLTDGVDSGVSTFTFDQAINEAARWAVPIYPIGFGGVDQVQLEQMATLTGGSAQIEPDSSSLITAFQTIGQILRQQYSLVFQSSLPADAAEHELRVVLDYQGAHQEATHNFTAKPNAVQVTFDDLQDGQTIGGKLKFAPSILAPAPLERLDITIDGQPLESVLAAPFELAWDAAAVAEGPHTFEFTATDSAGNHGSLALTLNVRPAIIINITSPLDGQELSSEITITAEIDAMTTLTSVEFLINGESLASFTQSPYQATWQLAAGALGDQTITVVASDVNGNVVEQSKTLTGGVVGGGIGPLVIAIGVALGLLVIPISIRARRKMAAGGAQPGKPAGQAVLREIQGISPNRAWSLSAGETRLGRKKDENEIPLMGRNASRRHAMIRPYDGKHIIYTLSPNNPVVINDQPVPQQQVLNPGDIIRLGESVFLYEN